MVTEVSAIRRWGWFAFCVAALFLLGVDDLNLWAAIVIVAAGALAAFPGMRPRGRTQIDGMDLLAIAGIYAVAVGLFRLAFTVFTTDNVLGLFLSFAGGLLVGVIGPVVYQVWVRGRDLSSLGLGAHDLPTTAVLGLTLAAVQFVMTIWGYEFPAPVDWVPLLVMSLVVGFFEAVFFRGFVQGRLERAFGAVPAVAGAAALYSLYHVGYGMGAEEMWFLFGLGVVYAIVYRLTINILILWPLLTPLGAFFNNLQAGDIDLPWESILGFADVAILMVVVIWLARRHRRRSAGRQDRVLSEERA